MMVKDAQPAGGFGAETLGRLRSRAEQAAATGEGTFRIPEAASVADRVAAMAPPGPLRTAAEQWLAEGASYHALVRLAARVVMDFGRDGPPGDAVYGPKAADELEPIFGL